MATPKPATNKTAQPPKTNLVTGDTTKGGANAVLKRLDGKASFTFEIPPQQLRWSYKNTFNALAVLRTAQPLVNYQYSEGALGLSTCYFWEQDISALKDLMHPEGEEPPICSFMWGDIVLPRVYVSSLDITETSRTDKSLEAEGAISFVFAPEPKPPEKVAEPKVELTNREIDALQKVVAEEAKKKPDLAKKLGGVPVINSKGEIEVLGKIKGKVTDFIKATEGAVKKISPSKEKLINTAASQKVPRESLQNSKK